MKIEVAIILPNSEIRVSHNHGHPYQLTENGEIVAGLVLKAIDALDAARPNYQVRLRLRHALAPKEHIATPKNFAEFRLLIAQLVSDAFDENRPYRSGYFMTKALDTQYDEADIYKLKNGWKTLDQKLQTSGLDPGELRNIILHTAVDYFAMDSNDANKFSQYLDTLLNPE